MQERIRKILEYSGLNQGMFADKICVAAATLSNILKGKTKPSLDIVQNIRMAFPEINAFWLLDGTGEMLSTVTPSSTQNSISQNSFSPDLSDTDMGDPFSTPAVSQNAPHNLSNSHPTRLKASTSYPLDGNYMDQETFKMVKYIDKQIRKVKEIQIFYDDGTYEVFVPRK